MAKEKIFSLGMNIPNRSGSSKMSLLRVRRFPTNTPVKFQPIAIFLVLVSAPLVSKAQQYTIPGTTIPATEYVYNSQFHFGNNSLVGSTTVTPPSAVAAPNFSANLAAVNTITWTLSAPTGYKFVVQQPAGASSANLVFAGGWIDSTGNSSGGSTDPNVQVSLTNGMGAFTSNSLYFNYSSNADDIGLGGTLGVSTISISFTALTLTIDLSSITNRTGWTQENYIGNQTSSGFGAASFYSQVFSSTANDPGSPVNLVAVVPEPSTTAALVAGTLGLLALAARRSGRTRSVR